MGHEINLKNWNQRLKNMTEDEMIGMEWQTSDSTAGSQGKNVS